ncbi:MAG: hypothetical protein R3F11_19440 [Verrucomicrobiales bacterium]
MSSLGLRFFPPTPDPKNHAAIGSPGSFALAAAAAGLACWAFWAIQPDGMRGVGTMLALLWGGSVAHAFLPLRARLPFFVLLTFAAIILVFPTEETTAIIAGGLALIGARHLPVAFGVRCGIVMVLSGALAAFWANATAHGGRLIWGDTMLLEEVPGWVFTAVPILGTLFMFRLAVISMTCGTSGSRSASGSGSAFSSCCPTHSCRSSRSSITKRICGPTTMRPPRRSIAKARSGWRAASST